MNGEETGNGRELAFKFTITQAMANQLKLSGEILYLIFSFFIIPLCVFLNSNQRLQRESRFFSIQSDDTITSVYFPVCSHFTSPKGGHDQMVRSKCWLHSASDVSTKQSITLFPVRFSVWQDKAGQVIQTYFPADEDENVLDFKKAVASMLSGHLKVCVLPVCNCPMWRTSSRQADFVKFPSVPRYYSCIQFRLSFHFLVILSLTF